VGQTSTELAEKHDVCLNTVDDSRRCIVLHGGVVKDSMRSAVLIAIDKQSINLVKSSGKGWLRGKRSILTQGL
jgi:hypothetical protein